MAIERKTVTKPAEPHPFESFGAADASTGHGEERTESKPETTNDIATATKRPTKSTRQPVGESRRGRGSGGATASQPADPLVTRTYRIPESYDARLQHGSLVTGMRRGRSVNKSDLVREAIDEYLTKHDLDD